MAKTFWLILTIAALVWYSTITIYVTIKGAGDIRRMLENLKKDFGSGNGEDSAGEK